MISPEQLQIIADHVSRQVLNDSVIASLRKEHPAVHFTYCMEDDIPNHKPLMECGHFNLYLVDGREHCLCLTRNYEYATGVVIAEVIEA